MALATLAVDLVANLAQFLGDLDKAARASEAASQRMGSAFSTVKKTLGGIATAATFVEIVSWAKEINRGVDAINDLKDATGASIANISALEDVALRTGSTFETVSTALIKFNKALKDAKPDNDAGAALRSIGLDAEQLKKIDPAEALLKTAQALQKFADDGGKARLAQELFGKSLKDVAPLLKDLAEKGKLVGTVTAQQAEEAERLSHALSELGKNSTDAGRALLADLAPSLSKTLEAFNGLRSIGGIIPGTLAMLRGTLSVDGRDSGEDINKLISKRTKLQDDYNKTLSYEVRLKGSLRGGSDQIAKDIESTNKLLDIARVRQRVSIDINSEDSKDAVSRKFKPPSIDFNGAETKVPKAPKAPNADNAFASLQGEIAKRITANLQEADSGKKLTESQQFLLDSVQKLGNAEGKYTAAQKIAVTAALEKFAITAKALEQSQEFIKLQEEEGKARIKNNDAALKHLIALDAENEGIAKNNSKLSESLEELGLTTAALSNLRLARLDANIEREKENLLLKQNSGSAQDELLIIERRIALLKNERGIQAITADKTESVTVRTSNEGLADKNKRAIESLQELGLTTAAVNNLRLARLDANIEREKENLLIKAGNAGSELERQEIEKRILLLKDERNIVSKTSSKTVEVEEKVANEKRSVAISESISDGILNGFRDGKSGADIFLTEIKAQFAKTVLQPVIEPIVKAGSELLNFGIKTLISSFGIPSFAVGTNFVPRDMLAQIHQGERILTKDENKIFTAGSGQKSDGAVNVVQNFTVGDVATVSMVRQAVANSQRQIAGAIGRSRAYGGAFA